MLQRYTTWSAWAAGFSFFAAADAALGLGAVDALAELCLTNTNSPITAPEMPMAHDRHAMPWLIAGVSFVSFTGFGRWMHASAQEKAAWGPKRRPILAAVALVASAQGRVSPEAMAHAWNRQFSPAITAEDAKIAMARFAHLPQSKRHALLRGMTHRGDRAAFLCIALRLLREYGDETGKALAMVETLADDIGLSDQEIMAHWESDTGLSTATHALGTASQHVTNAMSGTLAVGLRSAAHLKRPLGAALRHVGAFAVHAGHAAVWAFVRAFSSPKPATGDDQLAGLRRRFRRRGLSSRLQSLAVPTGLAFRRGLS